MKLGQIELARNDYLKAMRYFQEALKIVPDFDDAELEIGKIYQRLQRDADAITMFERISESSPSFRQALDPLIALYTRRGDYDKVISLALKLLKFDESNTQVRYVLADAYARRGDMENAANSFRELTMSAPEFGRAWLGLGLLYLLQNRADVAVAQFDKVADATEIQAEVGLGLAVAAQFLQAYQDAIASAQAVIAAQPDNQLAKVILGNIYVSQKSFSDALKQFQQVTLPMLEPHAQEQALRSYYGDQSAVSAAYYNLGLLCASRQWLTLAKDAYSTALWRTEKNPLLHFAIGKIQAQLNQSQQATKSLETALGLAPELALTSKMLGDLYQRQKNFDKAIEAYQAYVKQAPDDGSARLYLGVLYEGKRDPARAMAEYQDALRINPNDPLALNQLAWKFAEQKQRLDEALQFAQKAVELTNSPEIRDTLGWVYYQRGEYAQAIEQFRQALQQRPFQPAVTYHLGLAYYRSGDAAEARRLFEALLEVDPKHEHAAEIRQILKEIGK